MRGSTGEGAIFKFDGDGPWPGKLKGCAISRYRGNAVPLMRDQSSDNNWVHSDSYCQQKACEERGTNRKYPVQKIVLGENSCMKVVYGRKMCILGENYGFDWYTTNGCGHVTGSWA